MNIPMSSSLFFTLFLLGPFTIILLLLKDYFKNKENLNNEKLKKRLDEIFYKFELKNIKLSENEEKRYIDLKKFKNKYFLLIDYLPLQLLIGFVIFISFLPIKFKYSNKVQSKVKKDLINLESDFLSLIIVGVFSKNKFINKVFLLMSHVDVVNLEVDSISNENLIKNNIQNISSSIGNFSFLKTRGMSFMSIIK